jgi:hypothetical protein
MVSNAKGNGGLKLLWNIVRDLSQHLPVWAENNYEIPRNCRSLGRDLKPVPPEYESRISVAFGASDI